MKLFLNTLYYLLVAAIIALALLLVATLFPIKGNYQVKIVQSGSMEPSIQTGSVIVIQPSASYALNDVVTFGADTAKDIPTTHRIVGLEGTPGKLLFTTKGDANEEADTRQVPERDVIGKVLFAIPYVGFVLDFARQPIGFFLLIIIPATAVAIDEILNIWKEVMKLRRPRGPSGETPV
jgi:signal peptidase I